MTHPLDRTLSTNRVSDAERDGLLAAPEFGARFTDHMVQMIFDGGAWGTMRLLPFGDITLSPAALALHYGQAIFEAFKAYAQPDGSVAMFRPDANGERMRASAERMAIPALPDGVVEQSCAALVDVDRRWVPTSDGSALYLRPFIFASEAHLSVRPAECYHYMVIASPVASYFGPTLRAISVAVERRDVRAAPGGTGAAKFAGNYAAGFAAHGRAVSDGCDQVMWLDAAEHRWIEELNAMNVMFVWRRNGDTVLSTPPLAGTILGGITRDSLLTLAADGAGGVDSVVVEPTSIDEVADGLASGELVEVFACGTAAVIAPIGVLVDRGEDADASVRLVVGDGEPGPITMALRRALLDIQYGSAPDPHGWRVVVGDGGLSGR